MIVVFALLFALSWGCEDDPAFVDAQGYDCASWAGYDCTANGDYTAAQLVEVQTNCSLTCGTCPVSCENNASFVDESGYTCADWDGYECTLANYLSFGGTERGFGDFVLGCQALCNNCCEDDADFVDELGYGCRQWVGYACNVETFRAFGGSLSGFRDLERACAKLCDTCSCSDKYIGHDETDLNCGGSTCAACSNARACLVGADCSSGYCRSGACADPGPRSTFASISSDKQLYEWPEPVTVSFARNDTASPQDYIGVFALGQSIYQTVDLLYVGGSSAPTEAVASGQVVFTGLPEGEFEIFYKSTTATEYLYLADTINITIIDTFELTCLGIFLFSTNKRTYNRGEDIIVSFYRDTPAYSSDWIGISPRGQPPTDLVTYLYVSNTQCQLDAEQEGEVVFRNVPPGIYDVFYAENDGYDYLNGTVEIVVRGCEPGSIPGAGGECVECPRGTVASGYSNTACTPCVYGASLLGAAARRACMVRLSWAQLLAARVCYAEVCPVIARVPRVSTPSARGVGTAPGTSNNKTGQEACHACPVGSTSLLTHCVCATGFYRETTSGTCVPCVPGALCQDETIVPMPGFWQAEEGSTKIYACPYPGACLGGRGSPCTTGHVGPKCQKCADNYGELAGSCYSCEQHGGSVVNAFLFAVGVMLLVVYMLYAMRDKRVSFYLHSFVVAILVSHFQIIALLSPGLQQTDPTLFAFSRVSGAVSNGFLAEGMLACSIHSSFYTKFYASLFLFLVIPTVFPLMLYLAYTVHHAIRHGANTDSTDGSPNGDVEGDDSVDAVSSAEDAGLQEASDISIGSGDQAADIAGGAGAGAASAEASTKNEESEDIASEWVPTEGADDADHNAKKGLFVLHWPRTAAVVLMLFQFVHPIVFRTTLRSFVCEDVAGVSLLSTDLREECGSAEHTRAVAVGAAVLIIYCIGAPICLLAYQYSQRHALNSPTNLLYFATLYGAFKGRNFYWWSVVLVRKLGIVVFDAVLMSNVYLLKKFVLFSLSLSWAAQLYVLPYFHTTLNWMEIVSLTVLYLSFWTSDFLDYTTVERVSDDRYRLASLPSQGGSVLGIFIIVLNCLFYVVLLWVAAKSLRKKMADVKELRTKPKAHRGIHRDSLPHYGSSHLERVDSSGARAHQP